MKLWLFTAGVVTGIVLALLSEQQPVPVPQYPPPPGNLGHWWFDRHGVPHTVDPTLRDAASRLVDDWNRNHGQHGR